LLGCMSGFRPNLTAEPDVHVACSLPWSVMTDISDELLTKQTHRADPLWGRLRLSDGDRRHAVSLHGQFKPGFNKPKAIKWRSVPTASGLSRKTHSTHFHSTHDPRIAEAHQSIHRYGHAGRCT